MIRVNKENFEEEVLKYKGKVVVEFWSETCQPCKELLPGVEALSKKYNKSMKFCDIDTKRAPRIAIKQKVLSLPVIRIYEDGKILDETANGDVTIENIENMKTNIDGVYAIGDCRSKDLRQVITACNDGAIAAINVEKYIN